jgi:tetratricopeptide (TPR) repeat protein
MLSYLSDSFLFGIDSFAMHLHNVVLHAANAVLVFAIAHNAALARNKRPGWIPLVSALLFGLHPICTESVNWISGRTDVLAGLYILLSCFLLLRFRLTHHRAYLYAAFLAFFLGTLAKEVVLAFFPCFIWLILIRLTPAQQPGDKQWRRTALWGALAGIGAVLLFFLMRKLAFTSNSWMINTSLLVLFNTPGHAAMLIMTAFGFYLKKLFIPVPLNLAIYEVNALYEIAAYPLLAACLYVAWRRTLLSVFFIGGILLFSPAFIIVLNQISWMPYAERYLYIPAAFVTIATIGYLGEHLEFPSRRFQVITVTCLIGLAAFATIQRNFVWQTNFSIVSDTVRKSPYSADMQLVLAQMYTERKDYLRARQHIADAREVPGLEYDQRADLLEAYILEKQGDVAGAIAVCEAVFTRSKKTSIPATEGLIGLYTSQFDKGAGDRKVLAGKILQFRKQLYRLTKRQEVLYDIAKDALRAGDPAQARRFFQLTVWNLPNNNDKHKLAQRQLRKLDKT